jgi:hypothetical protein
MRLVTWNAGRGKFSKKVPLLSAMGADIAVIPEIAKPELINKHCLWFGTNPNQGIAITSLPSYTLTLLPEKTVAPRYVIPIRVEGSISFTLCAVWMTQRGESKRTNSIFEALFLGEKCADNLSPDHGEEKVFLDHADFRE